MLKRFSIAVEADLLSRFDAVVAEDGYETRSEAVRDLIRDALVRREWDTEESVSMGTIILVYDHHKHDLMRKLTEVQHDAHHLIIASLHTHLDAENCQEIIVMRGAVSEMKRLAGRLIATPGVKHGRLIPSTMGKGI